MATDRKLPKDSDIATPAVYFNRRSFLKAGAVALTAALPAAV